LEPSLVRVHHLDRAALFHAGEEPDLGFDRNLGLRQASPGREVPRIQPQRQNLLRTLSRPGRKIAKDHGNAQIADISEAERIQRIEWIVERRSSDGDEAKTGEKSNAGRSRHPGRGNRISFIL
jgi:hypothetical protein